MRSFVGGLELIVSLLKSSDREVFTFNCRLFEFAHCISVNDLLIQRNGSFDMSTRHMSDASQTAVNHLHSWAILLPKFLDRSSLLLVKDVLAFPRWGAHTETLEIWLRTNLLASWHSNLNFLSTF